MVVSNTFYARFVISLSAVLFTIQPLQAGEITRADMLSVSCSTCHGTDGQSPGTIPGIGGKPAEFIATALRQFGNGERTSNVMAHHATGYTDEEIQLIADYFASRQASEKQ